MLHAELRGKLSSEVASDAERGEDVLTSTVFGTLFAVGAWDVVAEWFSRARRGTTAVRSVDGLSHGSRYWFWPQLDQAEPDVVMLDGGVIIVIEAKYLAGKSGTSSPLESSEKPHDQLVREWLSVSEQADTKGYDPELRAAVSDSSRRRLLLYLVRRSRLARELDEIKQSLQQVPDAEMFVLTWEDLDEVLATRTDVRWAAELQRYLARRQLAAFRGFRSTMAYISPALGVWAARRTPATPRFTQLLSLDPGVSMLARRPSVFAPRRAGWQCLRNESVALVRNLARRVSPFMEP